MSSKKIDRTAFGFKQGFSTGGHGGSMFEKGQKGRPGMLHIDISG